MKFDIDGAAPRLPGSPDSCIQSAVTAGLSSEMKCNTCRFDLRELVRLQIASAPKSAL
jgi:hypothetical protein